MPDTGESRTDLFVTIETRGNALVAKFVGPSIGQREAPIVAQSVLEAIAKAGRACRHVVLDMSDVTFLNSMGLGACIEMRNAAHKLKAKTVLHGLSDELLDLLKMTRVDRIFTVVRNDAELTKAIAK